MLSECKPSNVICLAKAISCLVPNTGYFPVIGLPSSISCADFHTVFRFLGSFTRSSLWCRVVDDIGIFLPFWCLTGATGARSRPLLFVCSTGLRVFLKVCEADTIPGPSTLYLLGMCTLVLALLFIVSQYPALGVVWTYQILLMSSRGVEITPSLSSQPSWKFCGLWRCRNRGWECSHLWEGQLGHQCLQLKVSS